MERIVCEGAPRDCGADQGHALGGAIAAACDGRGGSGWWRALTADAETRRRERDLRRYFPHQAEWLEGMARAAGVPMRSLVTRLGSPRAGAAAALCCDGATRLGAVGAADSVVRRVSPEGRFASLELAAVTASHPWLGVNEVGLGVAVVEGRGVPGRFAAPAALFARDCLERFERVEPALEWCLSRPAAPGGALLLADADGQVAGVDASRESRAPLSASGEVRAFGLDDAAVATLGKARAGRTEAEAALVEGLAAAVAPGVAALVDATGRRLRLPDGSWETL